MNKNYKVYFSILVLILLCVVNIFLFVKSEMRIVENCDKIVYNNNLYLSKNLNNEEERFINEERIKIISRIEPLIIVSHKYSTSETLSDLAKKYGTNIASIRSTNYIEAMGLLYPGKELLITNKNGMLYKVQNEDIDVSSIAKKFNKTIEEICFSNNISPFYKFKKSEFVFIPEKYIRFRDFMLPLFNTKVTSGFGLRQHPIFGILKYHEGIDLKQKYGAPVRAACDGKVIFTGWAEGYGNLIILKHHKGYTTYYGHLSKIRVRIGQWVYKGQVIGNVGTTGWTTGPHLHFEVRKNGLPVNPKKVLF